MDAKELGNRYLHPVSAHDDREACGGGSYGEVGITLRQHFAGLAMQGMLSNNLPCDGITLDEVTKEVAGSAVAYADALLAELAKGQP